MPSTLTGRYVSHELLKVLQRKRNIVNGGEKRATGGIFDFFTQTTRSKNKLPCLFCV